MVSQDKYNSVRNQCSFVIRVDGEELEIPVSFGMTSDEIRTLYPFILPLANTKIPNPAVQFNEEVERGTYVPENEDEYNQMLIKCNEQSKFWYGKSEASLLDIAVRFALDIKLKGISELADIFDSSKVGENVKAVPISDEETEEIIHMLGIESEYESETDREDEIVSGESGSVMFDLYGDDKSLEYVTGEINRISTKLDERATDGTMDQKIAEDISNMSSNTSRINYPQDAIPDDGEVDLYDVRSGSNSGEQDDNAPTVSFMNDSGEEEDYMFDEEDEYDEEEPPDEDDT